MQGQVFEGDWNNSHLYLKPSTSSERMHRTCTWLAGTFKPSTRIGRVIRRPMALSLNRWNTGSAYAVHTQRSRRHPLPWQLNLPENIITTLFPKNNWQHTNGHLLWQPPFPQILSARGRPAFPPVLSSQQLLHLLDPGALSPSWPRLQYSQCRCQAGNGGNL